MSKFTEVINSHPIVLVDFYADWCGPCKAMSPELIKLKNHYGDRLKLVKINTEKNQKLATKFSIRSVPTLVLYRNGTQVARKSGGMMLPLLKKFVQPYLG